MFADGRGSATRTGWKPGGAHPFRESEAWVERLLGYDRRTSGVAELRIRRSPGAPPARHEAVHLLQRADRWSAVGKRPRADPFPCRTAGVAERLDQRRPTEPLAGHRSRPPRPQAVSLSPDVRRLAGREQVQ